MHRNYYCHINCCFRTELKHIHFRKNADKMGTRVGAGGKKDLYSSLHALPLFLLLSFLFFFLFCLKSDICQSPSSYARSAHNRNLDPRADSLMAALSNHEALIWISKYLEIM
ncbi:hypothetical protein I3760_14G044000 [Carya illinoinensis]|nr:hypothetical protein I3760_14G044000 [Carya illinoinensis]